MKVNIWYDIVCDYCGESYGEMFKKESREETTKYYSNLAKKDGWKSIKGRNICDTCFKSKLYLEELNY